MSKQTIEYLKGKFETGDIPTETDFADLIDSTHNRNIGYDDVSGLTGTAPGTLAAGNHSHELGELHDVTVDAVPVDGDVLTFETATGLWKNKPASGGSVETVAGYPDRTQSSFAYNSGTRTLTISPAVTNYDVWVKGAKKTISTAKTFIHDNTVGLHFCWFDANSNLASNTPTTTPWDILDGNALTSTIYWNGTKGVYSEERHGLRSLSLHNRLHGGEGAVYNSNYNGGAILSADGSSFSMTRTRFWDEDIPLDSGSATHTTANVWYRNAVNPEVWTWDDTPAADYRKMNGNIIQYDNNGVLTDLPDGYYCNYYMWHTNLIEQPIIVTVGQNVFSTDADAMAGLPPELPIGQEAIVLHRFTYQRVGSATNYIRRTDWRGINRKQIPPSISVTISQLALNAFPSAIDTTTATVGTVGGVVGNLITDDGTYLTVNEAAGSNPALRLTLKIPVDGTVSSLMTNGRYDGSASHNVGVYLALQGATSLAQAVTVEADNAYWDYIGNFNKNASTDATREFPLTDASHRNAGFVYVRFQHNSTTGIGTHDLFLDKVMVEYASQGLLASRVSATPSGNLSGDTVEEQLIELDTEKMPNVAPSTSGNVLTSNGSAWVSSAPTGGSTLYFPFFKSAGTADNINLISGTSLPFTKSGGSASNIPLIA